MQLSILLPDIRSVHNVGSIFRTADALGVRKLWLSGYTPTPLDRFGKVRPDFAKVSLGAERAVAWERAETAPEAIGKLKADDWKIWAVEQSKKSVPYYTIPRRGLLRAKIALVMGNEVEGLPPGVLKLCDKVLEIPMHGKKESLNVAVAFGIVAFSLAYSSSSI